MTSSRDAPAASSTVSMLVKVCSVCSARSSLTTLPVLGSKPPWPDRKIHSPTVSPGEYGAVGVGILSELMRAFMSGPPRGVESLDVFRKTEAAEQRGVGEEGDLVDVAAAQGEHDHAPGPRAQVAAEGRLAVRPRRA